MSKPDERPQLRDLTNDEFHTFVMNEMMEGWIPLRTYLKYYPTETKIGIETRLKRGVWQRGIHYKIPSRGSPWVNLKAIVQWIKDE